MTECADWIAAQLEEEEGMWVDAALVQQILELEREDPQRIPEITHEDAAGRVLQRLIDAGVQGVPDAIDQRLILGVLQWEDDFLSFAGRSRTR